MRDAFEEQAGRVQKERTQLQTGQPSQSGLGAAVPTKEETILRSKEFKNPSETAHPYWPGPDDGSQRYYMSSFSLWSSSTNDSLLPLTPRQLTAFQDIFKLFSCSPTGTVDMHSMKVALRNVGIQLGPQEMCEALRLADLDGDGIVSFKDFLGVLTDNHRLAQCMSQMKGSRFCEPPGLQTLFLEVLFKLLNQGFVPAKSRQEVTSYYFQKQRDLRLSSCPRNRARGPSRPARAHTGLTFFCQAARLNGLSSSQLARSLHTLCRAGGRSPYTQIPNLAGRPRPDRKTTTRTAGPEVRLPKPQQPGRPKLPLNLGPLSKGPLRPPAGLMSQPLEQMRPSKLASSPPTLVQKHPSSPSSACFQRCTIKSLYK
ncbi:rCG33642 [Rattus norvegicus]|uniref:RCG33642 n=2 Tax=Rattus norvegicus TaxID=10116 RepID=A6HJQ5_RAT|nr:EF-hand calcium-binding domain-containing protein 3 isoform X2 [Rattus norvegicus]EDM06260.1 rCG33642 [Rattus norvegicus]|eukprot:XP_017453214.1 PREDICTED: EF-hand calcium-binding domain-containing protein 3 isoform X2 [Rattus norvegicus]